MTSTEFDWLNRLDESDLALKAPALFVFGRGGDWTVEDVAVQYVLGGPIVLNSAKEFELPKDLRPERKYWTLVKEEFRVFLCTKDTRYAALRDKLATSSHESTTVVVGMVSAAMGSYLGLAAGVLTPFCAICLFAAMKIGKEAFCRCSSEQVDIPLSKGNEAG